MSKSKIVNNLTQSQIRIIVGDDPTITIQRIRESLKSEFGVSLSEKQVKHEIDKMTSNHSKSFVEHLNAERVHASQMDRFMMLITKHRKIKHVQKLVSAGNGAKYAVTFWADNGAKLKTWFVVNMEQNYVAYGADEFRHSIVDFQSLANRADLQANTIAWINNSFPENGKQMAEQLINDFELTIPTPSPLHLKVFAGFDATAEILSGIGTVHGKIYASQFIDLLEYGIESTIVHTWDKIASITIKVQF